MYNRFSARDGSSSLQRLCLIKALTAVAYDIVKPDLALYAFGCNVHGAGFIDEYAISGCVQQFIGGENLPALRVTLHPGGKVYVSPDHIILHPGL